MNPPPPMDSTYRMPWLGLGLALATLAIILAATLYQDYRQAERLEQDRLATQARVIAENMQQQLAGADAVLRSVCDETTYWLQDIGLLQTVTAAMPGVRTLNLLDRDGTILASNRPELIGRNFASRNYFQTARENPSIDTLYISPPFETVLGSYAINAGRILADADGQFAGLVTVTLDPEYFRTLMLSVRYAADMWTSMAHGDGTLFLMTPEREGVQGLNLMQPGSFFSRHRASGKEAEVLSGIVYATGERRMMALRTLQPAALHMDQPLVIAVGRDIDAIFQEWRRNATVQAGLFVLFAIAAAVGLFVYQQRRRKLEQEARLARQMAARLRFALDRIPTHIYMKDRQHRYIYANRVTLDLFGRTAEQLPGSEDSQFFPPETVAQLHAIDKRVMEAGEDTAEKIATTLNNQRRTYWEIKTPLYDDEDKAHIVGLCGISTDITELEQLKAQLELQAHQDYLTGLSNRRHFLELGQHELQRTHRHHQPLSLLMLDIDHFKNINDTYGHQVGDLVLQRFASILASTLRTIDMVGRLGGEEFAALLPDTTQQQAVEAGERLREAVAASSIDIGQREPLRLTISIGVTTLVEDHPTLDDLLSKADDALYQAKKSGRNRVCVATPDR